MYTSHLFPLAHHLLLNICGEIWRNVADNAPQTNADQMSPGAAKQPCVEEIQALPMDRVHHNEVRVDTSNCLYFWPQAAWHNAN